MPRMRALPLPAQRVVSELLTRQLPTQLVQIGANDASASTSNDPVQVLLRDARVHALLVEPNPTVFADLQHNLRSQGLLPGSRVAALNLATCPLASSNITFYVVDERFKAEFPRAPHWAVKQLGSVYRANTELGVATALEKALGLRHDEAIRSAPKYVRPITVPCLTPTMLLQRAGIDTAAAIDILAVDVEGLDIDLVSSFLALPSFRARLITFEAAIARFDKPERLQRLLRALMARGYQTSCHGHVCEAKDAFAWRPVDASAAANLDAHLPPTQLAHQFPPGGCTWANGCCKRHERLPVCASTRRKIGGRL